MDLQQIKTRLDSFKQAPKKEKIDYEKYLWKPKEGKYQIRIVPSKWDKKNPFKEVFLHYGLSKFPMYALTNWGEKDPIVEFSKQLRKESDKESWQLAGKLSPKMRIFAPVIVRGEEEKGVRLWEFGVEIYKQLLGIADDEDYGDFTDINEGRDFTVERVPGKVGGRDGLLTIVRVKPKVSVLSNDAKQVEKWLDEQPDILSIQRKYTFDQLKDTLQKFLVPDEIENEPEPEEKLTTKTDLPWDGEDETPDEPKLVKNVKPSTDVTKSKKLSKKDAFDELFNEEKN